MEKKRFLSVLLIISFFIIFVAPVTNGISSPVRTIELGHRYGAGQSVLAASQNNDVVRLGSSDMLQFNSRGHLLGFQPRKAYLAGLDHALSVEFLGTEGVMPLAESSGALSKSKKGASGAPPLSKVTYRNLWPGISLTYGRTEAGITESTYHIMPGGEVSKIRLRYNVPVERQKDGSLKLKFGSGFMSESAPVAWQEIGGRRVPVEVAFRVSRDEIGFTVAKYDPSFPLTIDPTYVWHTFYGSLGGIDQGRSIAVDSSGNVYVTGTSTASWNGPSGQLPLNAFSVGNWDIFVLKLNTGGGYAWHTFYGSTATDVGMGIAVDGSGNVYVTGRSYASWNGPGPTLPLNPYSLGGNANIVVLKLNTNGGYLWHTFYGSGNNDEGYGIAVDGSGNVYVTGLSTVTWNGPGPTLPLNTFSGGWDIVILKLNTSGAYQWHTFYGSAATDVGPAIAVDGSGNVYVAGYSNASWNGPSGQLPLDAFSIGNWDIFVLKLNTGGGYLWHTFYGSSDSDQGYGIAVDGSGNVYVTGYSAVSWNGPSGQLPLNAFSIGVIDIFVLKLNTGGGYLWHTFYGSDNAADYGLGIAVDSSGSVYVTGMSYASWTGPGPTSPLNPYTGNADIFVLKLNTGGGYLRHTFYGSLGGADQGQGIAVDNSRSVYVTGYSNATWNGPGASPVLPLNPYTGNADIAVIKMDEPTSTPTMNEWGMIIFMALAGVGSVYYLRRQRRV
jgi:hypothetical protein